MVTEVQAQVLSAAQQESTRASLMSEPAGSGSDEWIWLPVWLPITFEPDALFVDCRPGDLRGCVMGSVERGGQYGPIWQSTSAMWADVAARLEEVDLREMQRSTHLNPGKWQMPHG